jgi:catechol-2,3-dioxygenase
MSPASVPTFDNPGKTVMKPNRLAHFVLKTQPSTYKRLVNYYKVFLSAEANYEDDHNAFITYDDEHHRIGICAFEWCKPHVGESAGLVHTAFGFDNLHDLALAYRQRKANGILPYWCVNHGPTTSIYYRDPDGNDIETFCDNYATVAESNHAMTLPAFAENPAGLEYDPEVLVQRLQSGESDASIKDLANMPEFKGTGVRPDVK